MTLQRLTSTTRLLSSHNFKKNIFKNNDKHKFKNVSKYTDQKAIDSIAFFFMTTFVFLGLNVPAWSAENATTPVFRLHLNQEPTSLNPLKQKNSSAGYFLQQIYRNLLKLEDGKLKGDLAESCEYQDSKTIRCQLRPHIQFSDGSPITAADFIKTYHSFLNKSEPGFRADLLFEIENAKEILEGSKTLKDLGVQTPKPDQLVFKLKRPHREFIYHLSSVLLAPQPKEGFLSITEASRQVTSGPFKIARWNLGQTIRLESNSHYWEKNANRPFVDFSFVNEDSVALRMYETSQLDFLRRLPTPFLEKYATSKELLEIPVYRFDYFGFANNLNDFLSLRKALIYSLDYLSLQKYYHSKGPPGCPGLPAKDLDSKVNLCYTMDIPMAQKEWKKAQQELATKPELLKSLKFVYSKQGGEDHKRTADWLGTEWKKKLDLVIPSEALENKIFLSLLEQKPPLIFRKGLSPERPTCAAVLENFQKDHPENYLKIENLDLEKTITSMLNLGNSNKEKKKLNSLCSDGLKKLKDTYRFVSTGPIHFSMLLKPQWQGLKINELNQLNLSLLKPATAK